MTKKQCAVLVSSCDLYEDAWQPFFEFFAKYWKNCPYQVYLNTELKKCIVSDINIKTINSKSKEWSWSKRLRHALKQIDEEYIIFLLEDFFFLEHVNQFEIEKCIDYMNQNKKIAVFDFERAGQTKVVMSEYTGYCERDLSSMYFLNCQASLWRRKDLIRFLSPHESPWQFELYGSERAKLYNRKFLILANESAPVFVYKIDWSKGYGLHGGKWLKSNVKLFKEHGIEVDFSNMGFYKEQDGTSECPIPRKSLVERIMYFVYGGGPCPRASISEQFILIFTHPKRFLYMMKQKIKYTFTDWRDI